MTPEERTELEKIINSQIAKREWEKNLEKWEKDQQEQFERTNWYLGLAIGWTVGMFTALILLVVAK